MSPERPDDHGPPPASALLRASTVAFPLRAQAEKRYLTDALGKPFLIHGDTAWSIVGQLTDTEIDVYLHDRYSKGFTAVLLNAPEAYYTSQRPQHKNADGEVPFFSMAKFASPIEAYWRRVDRVVNAALVRGMVCVVNPAYLGAVGDGFLKAVVKASDEDLKSYGAWLARRYAQPNIIWSLGGDNRDAGAIAKQWNIVAGMQRVRADQIITAHPLADSRAANDAYEYWSGYKGFNLNSVYGWEQNGFFLHALCEQASRRSMPFVFFEGQYENEGLPPIESAQLRRQSYGALLSGACGQFFGNNPVWHFESRRRPFPYKGTWISNLDSAGAAEQVHVKSLFDAYEWWKLEPRTDDSLVTCRLGSNANRIYAALASDGSFAMVYVPHALSVPIDLSALRPRSVRARLFDPTLGTFVAVAESPFRNTGVATIRTEGERVIVLDANEPRSGSPS